MNNHPLHQLRDIASKHETYTSSYCTLADDAQYKTIAVQLIQKMKERNTAEQLLGSLELSLEERLQLQYYFNTINFYYWSGDNSQKWRIMRDGEKLDGSVALIRVMEESGFQSKMPEEILQIDEAAFKDMIQGSGTLEYIPERVGLLHAAAQFLIENNMTVSDLVASAGNDAMRLLTILSTNPAFADTTRIGDHEVPFLKRAQLLTKVIQDCLGEDQKLTNLNQLTAFSDYKVPQTLDMYGLILYSDDLRARLQNHEIIQKNSPEEAAIRLITICAVEKLCSVLRSQYGHIVNEAEIDSLLWRLAQDQGSNQQQDVKPEYHRTPTTAY